MAKQVLNNGETHGVIRGKANDNFTELYNSKTEFDAHLADYAHNWLKGKTINFISDSMGMVGDKTYPALVGELLESTVNNYAVSGDQLSGASGINVRVLNMDNSATVNVIMAGTNDWNNNVPIGNIDDTVNTTVYGALNIMCTNLINIFPDAINMLLTPLKRSAAATGFPTYSLEYLADVIMEVGKKYNFQVVDMYNNAPNFNPNIDSLNGRWESDGLHPNTAYINTFMADKIAKSLISLESSDTKPKVTSFAFTSISNITDFDYILEKDINKVVTLTFNGSITSSGSTLNVGQLPTECIPLKLSVVSIIGYSSLSPIGGWISDAGQLNILASTSGTTTIYGTIAYRVKN